MIVSTHGARFWVGGNTDAGGGVFSSSRQSLVELLGEEGHEGREEAQTGVQRRVQDILGGWFGIGVSRRLNRFQTLEVDVAQVVQPQVVAGGGCRWEVVALEAGVACLHGARHTTQHPAVNWGQNQSAEILQILNLVKGKLTFDFC